MRKRHASQYANFGSLHLWKKGIKKFRITQRNRCFGYVENGVFYVLRFDLDHELSDVG